MNLLEKITKKVKETEKKGRKLQNNKKSRYKLNKTAFQSFLIFMSVMFILVSFMYSGAMRVVTLAVSLAFAVVFPAYFAVLKIRKKEYLTLDLVISAAAIYLFCFGGYFESIFSLLFYVIVNQLSSANILFKPSSVKVYKKIREKKYHCVYDRESFYLDSKKISVGDNVELFSGEIIPVDGVVKAGSGTISTVNITGDSKVKNYKTNDNVYAGYILLGGNIIIEAKSTVEDSIIKKEGDRIQKISEKRVKTERISKGFFDIVSFIILAFSLIFVIYSYVTTKEITFFKYGIPLAFLCASTEISLSSVTNSYKAAMFHAMKKAIIIKDKSILENTLNVKEMCFDVAGVLTDSKPTIVEVLPVFGITEAELIKFAAYSLYRSETPFAKAILKKNDEKIFASEIIEFQQLKDNGAYVKLNRDIEIITATSQELKNRGIIVGLDDDINIMCIAVNDNFAGYIKLDYPVREDIRLCIDSLRFAGIKKLCVMSKGTSQFTKDICTKAGIDNVINVENEDQFETIEKSFLQSAILFSKGPSEYEKMFNTIRFGYTEEDVLAYTMTDSLTPAINYVNIVKDCKVLMIQNFVISLILKGILFSMLAGSQSVIGAVMIIIIGTLVTRFNCVRMINKL